MAAGNQWKEFTLALSKSTYLLLRTRKHKANRYFRACNVLPRNNTDVTYCEKTAFYFQNKAVYRAEDRPTDICLKMTKKLTKYFIIYFFTSGENQEKPRAFS